MGSFKKTYFLNQGLHLLKTDEKEHIENLAKSLLLIQGSCLDANQMKKKSRKGDYHVGKD